ncbi:hypothetical protein [Arthrobacter sp. AZCC_0090]|uniref:hypothetical protein n=1 Tax=Arthrobacter sp. AZCC_0090 TaxID=2735881 RepID=UPI00161E9683|nr:hypothetical protein [Arthrobacter sp. AZCC_0090]MBB6406789.1 hypothetical protein [Arthrobacter sp. AZCC_0090]
MGRKLSPEGLGRHGRQDYASFRGARKYPAAGRTALVPEAACPVFLIGGSC